MKILALLKLSEAEQQNILSTHPAVELIMAPGYFDGEIRETWPAFCCDNYLAPQASGCGSRSERDALLADADVIFGGWPYPLDMRRRSPNLKWFHQQPAGANNLLKSDLWESDVIVTTSRGYGNTLAIAEFALAGLLHFSKDFHIAKQDCAQQNFNKSKYQSLVIEGKTLCVVGAGGIGLQLGRLADRLGMRVVGTKRSTSGALPTGFSKIRNPSGLLELLAESHFVAICCQLTKETNHLLNEDAFNAIKPGGVIVNIARGEIIDEDAMVKALNCGHLRGAALDCYVGEFENPPSPMLWDHPKILITPHCSGKSDINHKRHTEVFCKNLKAFLAGEPMLNKIDWATGY